jgi:hypothetical protein
MSWKGGFSGIALKKQAQYYIDRQRFDTANSVSAKRLAASRDCNPTI